MSVLFNSSVSQQFSLLSQLHVAVLPLSTTHLSPLRSSIYPFLPPLPPPNSFICKYSLQLVFDLIQGFCLLEQHRCWAIAGRILHILLLSRVRVDAAARQGFWGQVLCELLVSTHLPGFDVCHPLFKDIFPLDLPSPSRLLVVPELLWALQTPLLIPHHPLEHPWIS